MPINNSPFGKQTSLCASFYAACWMHFGACTKHYVYSFPIAQYLTQAVPIHVCVSVCALSSVCLIRCWLSGWVAPRSCCPPPPFSFLAFKLTVAVQSKSSVRSQQGCESGVKLKKHTQWARRRGMTTFSEGEINRAHIKVHRHTHTNTKSVCSNTYMHFQRT